MEHPGQSHSSFIPSQMSLEAVFETITSPNLSEDDYSALLDAVEIINANAATQIPEAMRLLKAKFQSSNGNVLLRTITLLDFIAENCGAGAKIQIASPEFVNNFLLKIVNDHSIHMSVKYQLIKEMYKLSKSFGHDESLKEMKVAFNELRGKYPDMTNQAIGEIDGGNKHSFPPPSANGIDDDFALKKAIEMSLNDSQRGGASSQRVVPQVQVSIPAPVLQQQPIQPLQNQYAQQSPQSQYTQQLPQDHQQQQQQQQLPYNQQQQSPMQSFASPIGLLAQQTSQQSPVQQPPLPLQQPPQQNLQAPPQQQQQQNIGGLSPQVSGNSFMQALLQESANAPDKVVALFELTSDDEDTLSFKKDDIITVVEYINDDWLRGCLHGQAGIVPVNYVKKIPKIKQQDLQELVSTLDKSFDIETTLSKLLDLNKKIKTQPLTSQQFEACLLENQFPNKIQDIEQMKVGFKKVLDLHRIKLMELESIKGNIENSLDTYQSMVKDIATGENVEEDIGKFIQSYPDLGSLSLGQSQYTQSQQQQQQQHPQQQQQQPFQQFQQPLGYNQTGSANAYLRQQ